MSKKKKKKHLSKAAVVCLCVMIVFVLGVTLVYSQMVLLVQENPMLAEPDALEKCRHVMELICEKCVKQQDMNEVLAMKMHYISCVLQKCAIFIKDHPDKLDGLIKR